MRNEKRHQRKSDQTERTHGTQEQVQVAKVQFLGEQDGIPERELKRQLSQLFTERGDIKRAYLARVQYDGATDGVALCLLMNADCLEEVAGSVQEIFAEMFGSQEHLDILSLDQSLDADVSRSCVVFFDGSGNIRNRS